MCREYKETDNFNGLREIILKARKEGFTSFVLGLFCSSLILSKYPTRYLEISYKDDATAQHFRRAKSYIMSFYEKDPLKWSKALERQIFDSLNEGKEFVLKHNKASFYVGTASARTGERGGTVQGVLFSESAHYPETGIINASEIIEGTRNMVAVGSGMIFQESTANGFNHFKKTWDMAKRKEVDYKPRFFSWDMFYTPEQFEKIKLGFSNKKLIEQEYPLTDFEAFLSSGACCFDVDILKKWLNECKEPLYEGILEDVEPIKTGALWVKQLKEEANNNIEFIQQKDGYLKVYEKPNKNFSYAIGCDTAEGGESGDKSVISVKRRDSWKQVAYVIIKRDPDILADMLNLIGRYYNDAVIGVESNNHGLTTLTTLRRDWNYPNIYQRDVWDDKGVKKTKKIGWQTNVKTKPLLIDLQGQYIRENREAGILCRQFIDEHLSFVTKDDGKQEGAEGCHDDCVIADSIATMMCKIYPHFAPDTRWDRKQFKKVGVKTEYDTDSLFQRYMNRNKRLGERRVVI